MPREEYLQCQSDQWGKVKEMLIIYNHVWDIRTRSRWWRVCPRNRFCESLSDFRSDSRRRMQLYWSFKIPKFNWDDVPFQFRRFDFNADTCKFEAQCLRFQMNREEMKIAGSVDRIIEAKRNQITTVFCRSDFPKMDGDVGGTTFSLNNGGEGNTLDWRSLQQPFMAFISNELQRFSIKVCRTDQVWQFDGYTRQSREMETDWKESRRWRTSLKRKIHQLDVKWGLKLRVVADKTEVWSLINSAMVFVFIRGSCCWNFDGIFPECYSSW